MPLHEIIGFVAGFGTTIGAGDQTGWTGIIARIMHLFATTRAKQLLEPGEVAL